MAISFDAIPGNLRVPLFYAELSAGGTPFDSSERLLLIGQATSAGTATLDEPVLVPSSSLAEDGLFGSGSMLAAMVKRARANAPFQEIWALPVTENAAGTAASADVTLTGLTLPVTSVSSITIYVAGTEYNISVLTTDTATTIGDKLVTEITEDLDAPVTAANDAGVVTLTARHKGEVGNTLDVRTDYYGDEGTLSGEIAVTAFTGGTNNPDISTGIAALGDEDFLWVASAYSDAANVGVLTDWYNDASGRWSPYQQLYGHAVMVKYDTVSNLSTFGNTMNDAHVTVVGTNKMPDPAWETVACLGAQVALHLSDAPELSRPLQTIVLQGLKAPKIADRFDITDRNTLLWDGIGTLRYSRDGEVMIDRLVTTYQTNAYGSPDATFLDLNTMAQSQYILRYLRQKVENRHGRQALADDDAPAISGVTRPKDARATLIAGYAELAALGVVESQSEFEEFLVVERNATDANRLDVSLPFDAINQLRIFAVAAQANLQF